MKNKLSVTFLYPSKKIGGAQLLFVRLAQELAKFDDITVNVIDYPGGYLESQLVNNEKVNTIPYSGGSSKIDSDTLVITPSSNLADIGYLLKGDRSKINLLFWAINPQALGYVFNANGRRYLKKKGITNDLVSQLSTSGHIIYMDEVNYKAAQDEVPQTFKPVYMPIPLEIPELPPQRAVNTDSGGLNICWLGRFSYDKINSIYKIIDEIKLAKETKPITLHIIGDGEKMDDLKAHLEQSGIRYVLVGVLEKEALTDYLLANIDLGISMGTSCIEFAALKIPVCIIDYSLSTLPASTKYNWLYETEHYTLGGHVDLVPERNHTFAALLQQVKTDPQLGERGYEYVYKHHNLKMVAAMLRDYCRQLPKINWQEFDKAERELNPLLYRIIYGAFRKILKSKQ